MSAAICPDSALPLRGLRVCMLTADHPADDDRIFFKEARSLVRYGADVVVVCHAGKALPTDTGGVRFRQFPKRQSWAQRFRGVRALAQVAAAERYDVIHCHEPDALVAALRLKQATGAKVIYDSHESWGANFAQRFPRPLWRVAQAFFEGWEKRLVRRCNAAIGASWAISDYLRAQLPARPVKTLLNVPVAEVFGEAAPRAWGDTTVLVHDGHLGFDRGLKTMVRAAHQVSRKHKVVLRIVGDVFDEPRAWLDQYLARHQLETMVVRTGWLPYQQVGRNIAVGHIGLIALQKLPNNITTSSNKVFNYLLYGIPFIGPDFRLAKIKLAQEEQCGVLADSASPESYAAAISNLIEHRDRTLAMGRRAAKASEQKYRWSHMEAEMVSLYRRILGQPPSYGN
jgi:glycosyltransferase involved in cell wall biosynthesis